MKDEELISYLAEHDSPCPACYRNLRGCKDAACPACAKVLVINEVMWIHGAFQNQNRMPRPMPGSPEATHLDRYFLKYKPDCPGCGYQLHRLTTDTCPECGKELVLDEFLSPPTDKGRTAHADVLTIFSVIIIGFTAMFSLLGALTPTLGKAAVGPWVMLTFSCVLGWVMGYPARRMMYENLRWAWLFNPVVVVGVYIGLFYAISIVERAI